MQVVSTSRIPASRDHDKSSYQTEGFPNQSRGIYPEHPAAKEGEAR